jgi:hypothetical protein
LTRKAGFHENASITKPGDDPAALPVPKLHPAYLDRSGQEQLLAELRDIIRQAPLFPPRMPRTGSPFSVPMTNCGRLGWVSDIGGYRYQETHPLTGQPWPPIPELLRRAWSQLGHYRHEPEACLINYYGAHRKDGFASRPRRKGFAGTRRVVVLGRYVHLPLWRGSTSRPDTYAPSRFRRRSSPTRPASLFMAWTELSRGHPLSWLRVVDST